MKLTIQTHTRHGITARDINAEDALVFDMFGLKLIFLKGVYYFCSKTLKIKYKSVEEVRLNEAGDETCEYTAFVQVNGKTILASVLYGKSVKNLEYYSSQLKEPQFQEFIRQSKMTNEDIVGVHKEIFEKKQKEREEKEAQRIQEDLERENKRKEIEKAQYEVNKEKFKNFDWVTWEFISKLAKEVGISIPIKTKGWANKNVGMVRVKEDGESITYERSGKVRSDAFVCAVLDTYTAVK